jgi:hypothetical protein
MTTGKGKAKRTRKGGGTKAKPWRNRGRLALLDLEPQVELMMLAATPDPTIVAWCVARGASDNQATGLIRGIRGRWLEVRDDAVTVAQRKAEFRRRLDWAWNLATHEPILDAFGQLRTTDDGNIAVRANLSAVPKLLKLQMDLDGLAAPTKSINVNMNMSPAALSPAERRTEIDRLLERRQQHLLAAGSAPAREQPVLDVPAVVAALAT